MEINIVELFPVILSLAAAAVGYGVLRANVGAQGRRLDAVERRLDRQGDETGQILQRLASVETLLHQINERLGHGPGGH